MTPYLPGHAQGEAAEKLSRNERRCFRLAGVFLALAATIWACMQAHGWLLGRRLYELLASNPEPDLDEMERLVSSAYYSLLGFGILMLILLLVFLWFFIGWLLAIRKRRQAERQLFQ